MRPPSLHSNFFSSLRQVEKRLKLERPSSSSDRFSPPQEKRIQENNTTPSESLSSPIYLLFDQPNSVNENKSSSSLRESSEPPPAFLSCSTQFPTIDKNPPQADNSETTPEDRTNDVDDIEFLIRLLGLSDYCQEEGTQEEEEPKKEKQSVGIGGGGSGGGNFCECEGGFYEKIVGVKGPKCEKEVKRLEGWIKYFLKERKEPLRLAFLLLGKAAYAAAGDDSGFGGLEFPSAIDQFLKNDPPKD